MGLPIGSCAPSPIDPVGLPTWPCPMVGEKNTVPELFWWPDVGGFSLVRLWFPGWGSRFLYFEVLGCLVGAWLCCFCCFHRRSATKGGRAKNRQSKFTTRSPPWFRVVCSECLKVGLGKSGVQRVQAARLRARDRARRHQARALSLRSREPPKR